MPFSHGPWKVPCMNRQLPSAFSLLIALIACAALGWGAVALFISGAVFWGIAKLRLNHAWAVPGAKANDGSVKAIGVSLLTTYSLAFEVISLVLLVAILGALVIARYGRTKP